MCQSETEFVSMFIEISRKKEQNLSESLGKYKCEIATLTNHTRLVLLLITAMDDLA